MAIKANLVIDQGTSFSAVIDVTDTGNAVYNLTGYTVAAQMRKNYSSSTAVTFSSSHNSSGGQITLLLTAANTISLEPGRYLYDVEITSAGGTVTRVVEGVATVTPGMTRI
jgi:Ethanolamine utilization protein EutJ (predicted chaperonin)